MMVLIQRLQEETVDPIGFGSKYRAFVRGKTLTDEIWRNQYSKASIKVNVHLKLIRDGEIE